MDLAVNTGHQTIALWVNALEEILIVWLWIAGDSRHVSILIISAWCKCGARWGRSNVVQYDAHISTIPQCIVLTNTSIIQSVISSELYHTCDRTERREISWIKIVWKYAALMDCDLRLITELVWFAAIAPNGMIWIPPLILRDPLHINYSIIELNYYLTGDSKGSISSSRTLTSCSKISSEVGVAAMPPNACLQSSCHISWHQLSFWESQTEFLWGV